jgi:hypothetical protein
LILESLPALIKSSRRQKRTPTSANADPNSRGEPTAVGCGFNLVPNRGARRRTHWPGSLKVL